MSELELKILKSINRHVEENESMAYFECVCTEVFGELNEKNEELLKNQLEKMDARVIINGDRLGIREPHIVMMYDEDDDFELLDHIGLEMKKNYCDIGSGCNVGTIVTSILEHPIEVIMLMGAIGEAISNIGEGIKAWEYIKLKIKEFKNSSKESEREIYYHEEMLKMEVISKIMKEYDGIQDLTIRLVDSAKIKISSLGLYAVQNSGYSERSLAGSPEYLKYFIFEVSSNKLEKDTDIIRCEILSNLKIVSFQKVSLWCNSGVNEFQEQLSI